MVFTVANCTFNIFVMSVYGHVTGYTPFSYVIDPILFDSSLENLFLYQIEHFEGATVNKIYRESIFLLFLAKAKALQFTANSTKPSVSAMTGRERP